MFNVEADGKSHPIHSLFGLVPLLSRLHQGAGRATLTWILNGFFRRLSVVVLILILAAGMLWAFMPETEYLPEGNQLTVMSIIIPPQGYSLEEFSSIGRELEKRIQPMLDATVEDFDAGKTEIVPVRAFFFVSFGTNMFIFSRPKAAHHAGLMIPALYAQLGQIPGVIPIVTQTSIFGGDFTGTRAIDLEITGEDITQLTGIAFEAFMKLNQEFQNAQVRPLPGIEIGQPQVSIKPDWERAAELGISAQAIGYGAWVLGDGAFADEYYEKGDKMGSLLVFHDGRF